MVSLLNLLDPASLVDQKQDIPPEQETVRKRSLSFYEQHSSLSNRGVALVGGASALAWYMLRLLIRDRFGIPPSRKRDVLELHALSTFHAFSWVIFIAHKVFLSSTDFAQYVSRALVASLGFYLQDCLALRTTLLHNPAMLLHQASVASCIVSILKSKGVVWLGPPLMSLAIPTLVQELLLLCGTVGLPIARPEVKMLRILWFLSFGASKLALVPLWFKYYNCPELHQPNLLLGKVSYLASLALNTSFLVSAARDLPRFLLPRGEIIPAAAAYRVPLQGVQAAATAVVAAGMLSVVFGSYLFAPVAGVIAVFALKSGSRRLRGLAGLLCGILAIDRLAPMPRECSPLARLVLPIIRAFTRSFRHHFMPKHDLSTVFSKDRHHLLAVTPHGFFPWGVAAIIVDLLDQGYLPNFMGASVLGALPIAGRLLRTFGYRPATRKEIKNCLSKEYPRNVTIIIPGGIREMFLIREDAEMSAANLRKGFVDMAVQSGAMLWPGYMFGSSRLYQVADGALGKFFGELSRKLQTSLNLFHGRWGTLLPYPHKLACAIGEPVDTREVAKVDDASRLWLESLRKAFEQHKSEFGWPDRKLYFEGEAMPPPPRDPLEEYFVLPRLSRL